MTFHFVGFNNYNMYGFGGMRGCCNSYSPFLSYNCMYNPFTVFDTAMQFMSGKVPNIFNYNSYQPLYFQNSTFNNNFSIPKIEGNVGFDFNSLYNGFGMYTAKDYSKTETPSYTSLPSVYSYGSEVDLLGIMGNTSKSAESSLSYTASKSYKPQYTTFSSGHLDKTFLDKAKQVAKNINCDYEDLLAVMNSESSLNPVASYKNKNGVKTAVGLIQFTKQYAIPDLNKNYGLDLTVEKIEKMSAIEQLDLAEKYYKLTTKKFGGKKLTAADLYASTYLPARATKSELCRKGETNSKGKLLGYYESNRAFDKNNDGVITKEELNKHLSEKRVSLSTFA